MRKSYIIQENTNQKIETLEELIGKSLANDITLITDGEKSNDELLTEYIYEDFVKAR